MNNIVKWRNKMKRSNRVLTTPANVSDLVFEDYFDEGQVNTKAERSAIKAQRKLKHQIG